MTTGSVTPLTCRPLGKPKTTVFEESIGQRLIQREHQWLMFSATERYLKVLQEAPGWPEQVPQHRLASYLGVTDVALSRIRRRLKSGF